MYYCEQDGAVSKIYALPSIEAANQDNACSSINPDVLMLDQTLAYYTACLSQSDRAQAFLLSRGIYDEAAIEHFRLGFVDRTLGLTLKTMDKLQEACSRGALQRLGLLKPSGHEFFCGAIVFPFISEHGEVVGGYGRRVTPKLSAGAVYHVHWYGEELGFFNQQALLGGKSMILCKNPIEALSWWCNGFQNVMGLMGIYSFEQEHLTKLKVHRIKQVYLAFGSQQDELEVAWFIARQLSQVGIEPKFILYPNGLDANALVQLADDPQQALQQCLDNALVFAKYLPIHRIEVRR